MEGLETEDCAAALAYLAERDSGDRPRDADHLAECLDAYVNSFDRVELIDSDRAIVRCDGSVSEMVFLREDGAWKLGIGRIDREDREPLASKRPPRQYVSRRRHGKR